MSLSSERPANPATRQLEISGGAVKYWDKEKQEKVEVKIPFEFIVLDQLATVRGWCDDDSSNFWSNEVRSVGRDELTVRTAKGVKAKGLWSEIKTNPEIAGARYHTSVYLAHQTENGLEIAKLLLKGSSLKSWIELNSKGKPQKVVLTEFKDDKKGAVSFKVPVFERAEFSNEAEKNEAVALDKQLQEYFNEYLDNKAQPASHTDVAPDNIDDEPIDLSEIPF